MIRVAFVRGAYLNKFEWQNYNISSKEVKITPVSSYRPLNSIKNSTKLFSLFDLSKSKPVRYFANRTFGDSQVLFGLPKIIRDFDILHTADPHYFYSYQLSKLKRDKPLVSTFWDTIPFNNESTKRKKYIKKFSMKNTDLFICHTKRAKKCIEIEGFGGKQIEVIPLGVDLKRFTPIKKERKPFTTILFVGRLVKEKGVLDLYSAFKTYLGFSKYKKIRLLIVGEGPLKKELINKINKDKLNNYITVEQSSYDLINKIYQKADIFVMPSKATKTWEEQYGMVLLEALASGLPIIAYDSGSVGEVLANQGILIREGDINSLTNSINRLITYPVIRSKLGKEARICAEKRYNCIDYKRKITNIYKSLI
ncbi:MAG: hypothetical protein COU25_01735 [Candidatus Levybacteria bacterium CG10_big_fil_rev_8_21_14_0_10_35_13]|nr:MAG: hypothetical protein COU25_01735 [Candidatus Levybacteria bacterium CG10_big_fil_rev_8_21_14_0_10_35_13]